MNDREPFDAPDPHLSERMERAVGDLRAPDVLARAMVRGRRQRTHRRLTYAGGVAATTALVLTVSAFAIDWPGREPGPSGSSVAADPTAGSPTATALETDGPEKDACGAPETGWWTKSTEQIKADLSDLLPPGTQIGKTEDKLAGMWGGNLVAGDDADFANLALLPPPGILGPLRTLEEVHRLGPCGGGANKPSQEVQPCDEISAGADERVVDCEEIRSETGVLVGVVTEQTEMTIVDGQEQPTDRTHIIATLAVPGGGHVELGSYEGNRADRPDTVPDPAAVPALTIDQVREIVTDPVWTS